MRIATAAYPLTPVTHFDDYVAKQRRWVEDAVGKGAELLVFPEYGAMELAMLDGAEAAGHLEQSLHAAAGWMDRAAEVHAALATEHKVFILGPSGPVFDGNTRPVNRAHVFGPNGLLGYQDKQIMTRFERETWDVRPGGPLQIFDIGGIRTGILICYDAEFPLLGRALVEAGAEMILSPSCTEALSGYWRVRVGAMARALEGQCVSVHSPLVGTADWCPGVDLNTGAAAIYGPPDLGFPETGVLAEGALNKAGWVTADVSLEAIRTVRRDGRVLNFTHWDEQESRIASVITP